MVRIFLLLASRSPVREPYRYPTEPFAYLKDPAMFTLKTTFGIVTLIAIVIACTAATLRPASAMSEFPSGLLFALSLLLCVIAVSRTISTYPDIDAFWFGFLIACAICALVSFSAPLLSANTAPEHIAGFLTRLRPSSSEPPHFQAERFYAMQRIVNNTGVLVFAVVCGVLAKRRYAKSDTTIDV